MLVRTLFDKPINVRTGEMLSVQEALTISKDGELISVAVESAKVIDEPLIVEGEER